MTSSLPSHRRCCLRVSCIPTLLQISNELRHLRATLIVGRCAEDRGWMDGRGDERSERRLHEGRALRAHLELRPEDRLRRGGSEADDDAGFDEVDLSLQPGTAGVDLHRVRLLVNAPLSA